MYISAHGLLRGDVAVTKLMDCIQSARASFESATVVLALHNNTWVYEKKWMVKQMTDIILDINAPVRITNVDKQLCNLVKAKTLCATHDSFIKRVMNRRRSV